MVNLYSAHMDPDDWHQPQQFRPARFLDQSGNVVDRDRVIAFSLGSVYSLYVIRPYYSIQLKKPIRYEKKPRR